MMTGLKVHNREKNRGPNLDEPGMRLGGED